MVKLYKQISFADTFKECKDFFQNDKPKFLELLTELLLLKINACTQALSEALKNGFLITKPE